MSHFDNYGLPGYDEVKNMSKSEQAEVTDLVMEKLNKLVKEHNSLLDKLIKERNFKLYPGNLKEFYAFRGEDCIVPIDLCPDNIETRCDFMLRPSLLEIRSVNTRLFVSQ